VSTEKKVLSLTELRNPVAGVIELNGEQHKVMKYTGVQYQRAALFRPESPAIELYDLVKAVVPSLEQDVLLSLDKDLCSAILMLASQGIQAVELYFPNAPGPKAQTSPG
jgi:hypothetical protein